MAAAATAANGAATRATGPTIGAAFFVNRPTLRKILLKKTTTPSSVHDTHFDEDPPSEF